MYKTITCKHATVYVKSRLDFKVAHCSCCANSKPQSIRDQSEADVLVLSRGVTPKLAALVVMATKEYNIQHPMTIKTPWDMLGNIPTPTVNPNVRRSPMTTLNVHCNECGSTFTLHRTQPDTHQTPPIYCIYCASSNTATSQQDTEQAAFTLLAEHYHLPLPLFHTFYSHWQSQPTYVHFDDFMRSPEVTALLPILVKTN